MRKAQKRLFELPVIPRAKPQKLMHVSDAGPCNDTYDMVEFTCKRCSYVSDWMVVLRADAKRGIPCPVCSGEIPKPEAKKYKPLSADFIKDITAQ